MLSTKPRLWLLVGISESCNSHNYHGLVDLVVLTFFYSKLTSLIHIFSQRTGR